MKIVLATGNQHKVDEINLIARGFGVEFILPQGEFDPVEDGNNFLENAYCKALAASKLGGAELFLADDSGLCVEALGGVPGIHSARYAPTAKERINKLLKVLDGVQNRSAKFVCAMVIVDKNGEILFQTQGECTGSILKEERGNGGFGYDPIFLVESANVAMAEFSPEQKATISHRARALNQVLAWIKENKEKYGI